MTASALLTLYDALAAAHPERDMVAHTEALATTLGITYHEAEDMILAAEAEG